MSNSPPPLVRNSASVKPQPVERTRGASIQVLIGPTDGVPNFITRQLTLAGAGRIPCHRHNTIEHEQVMLSGSMVIGLDNREMEVHEGDVIFIPAGVAHWYENRTDETATFLCIVPTTEDYQTEWLEGSAD